MPLSSRSALVRRLGVPITTIALSLSLGGSLAAHAATEATAPMTQGRATHTATALDDGTVLVSGGISDGFVQRTAEIYRPGTGRWQQTGSMLTDRWYDAAATLDDGRVLVIGGVNDNVELLSSAEVYDAGSGEWTETGSLQVGRHLHTATTLTDGRVLVVGGLGRDRRGESVSLAGSEVFGAATGSWTTSGALAARRYGHTATLLRDGSVLVTGGSDDSDRRLASTEVYDPTDGTWTSVGAMVTGRSGHTADLLADGRVLVTGGFGADGTLASAELYDPSTRRWSRTAPLPTPTKFHTSTTVADGRVLVVGGENKTLTAVFDPASETWRSAGALRAARGNATATALDDGTVLVAGGFNNTTFSLRSAEIVTLPAPVVDTDGDTVVDRRDNCPAVANKSQADADTDGTGDLCESEHARSVTLLGAHQKVSGSRRLVLSGKLAVADSLTSCAVDRSVVLSRLDPATSQWTQVGAPRTASDGTYRAVLRDQTGRYRAQVAAEPVTRAGFTSLCTATQRNLQHGH